MTDPTDTTDFLSFRKRSEPKYPSAPSPESEVYKKYGKRGIAVIFNHKEYDKKDIPTRDGTDKDRDDLYTTLKELQFDVNAYDDLRSAEIAETLSRDEGTFTCVEVNFHNMHIWAENPHPIRETHFQHRFSPRLIKSLQTLQRQYERMCRSCFLFLVKDIDHSEHECLIVIVMSHGELDKFYTKDETFPVRSLWEPFFKVPSLAGKPKMFFIQACRGNKPDPGITVGYDEMDARNNGQKLYSIPISADVLVMYSSYEGYYSFRHPQRGSYFIQSLVRQLKTAEDRNLLSILTNVNREVAIMYSEKEMCTVVSTLTRRFYLD
ncbi:caspase-1 [Anoplophora glabripennis]|uniref:caspase-1 n=1 Tax=Anoplophora glabripennis TaxID=217634 RepID=UPI0008744CA8|nr:caspase-1 [Anoplophora glabripennis]